MRIPAAGVLAGGLWVLLCVAPSPGLGEERNDALIGELFESSFQAEAASKLEDALKDVLKILNHDPQNYVAQLRAGWLYYLKGDLDSSVKSYRKAVSLKPSAVEPQLGLVRPLQAQRNWKDAEEAAKAVLKKAPRNYTALTRLAEVYTSLGRHDEAAEVRTGIVLDYPTDVETMLGQAWNYLQMGQMRRAQPLYRAVADLYDTSLGRGANEEAAKIVEDDLAILRREPNHYAANLRAGWLNYLLGKYPDANRYYLKAVAAKPNAIEPRLGAILPQMAAGDWLSAEKSARDVLKRAPREYLASSRLAFTLFSLKRFVEAQAQYKEVLEDYPGDVDMMVGLGWTYFHQGLKPQAQEMFLRALAIRRDSQSAKEGVDLCRG
jgi:tetratricopeptide (TPR) repeat protein